MDARQSRSWEGAWGSVGRTAPLRTSDVVVPRWMGVLYQEAQQRPASRLFLVMPLV